MLSSQHSLICNCSVVDKSVKPTIFARHGLYIPVKRVKLRQIERFVVYLVGEIINDCLHSIR